MNVLTVRESFGGRWAANTPGWLILFVPSSLLVLVQESSTPFSSWWFVLLSAVLQHVLAGVLAAGVAGLLRTRYKILPLPVAFAVWAVIGVTRGVVGGLIAAQWAGADVDFGYRITFWIAISWVWMPLFVYSAAQTEHRMALLGRLTADRLRLADERERSALTALELQSALATTVQAAIGPVIGEIRNSLISAAGVLSVDSMRQIGDRLSMVSSDANRILGTGSGVSGRPHPDEYPSRRAPLAAALSYDLQRPGESAFYTGVALIPLVLPETIRSGGIMESLQALLAVVVVSVGLYGAARIRQRLPRPSNRVRYLILLASYLIAGALGSLTLLVPHLPSDSPLSIEEQLVAALLPLAVVFAAACLSSAVGLARANDDVLRELALVEAEIDDRGVKSASASDTAREQLSILIHGPVQSRLAACVMALNFHAAVNNRPDPKRTELVTNAVLSHLVAASADLDGLSHANFGRPSPEHPS